MAGAPEVTKVDKIKMWAMFAVVIALGVWFIHHKMVDFESPAPIEPVKTQADLDHDAGLGLAVQAMDTVRVGLKDPSSAKFRHVVAVKSKSGKMFMCGEVNARNSFGAFAGYTPFVASDAGVQIETADSANAVRRRWNATCAKYPVVYRSFRND